MGTQAGRCSRFRTSLTKGLSNRRQRCQGSVCMQDSRPACRRASHDSVDFCTLSKDYRVGRGECLWLCRYAGDGRRRRAVQYIKGYAPEVLHCPCDLLVPEVILGRVPSLLGPCVRECGNLCAYYQRRRTLRSCKQIHSSQPTHHIQPSVDVSLRSHLWQVSHNIHFTIV